MVTYHELMKLHFWDPGVYCPSVAGRCFGFALFKQ